ncbi:MAG: TldD/PmbA family protein [Candidatus Wallbacteria bacterium]|nr:TldD/PmbA family protein [Candidatus Wallbacteria bacterium]
MKVPYSQFLLSEQDRLAEIVDLLEKRFDYASILGTDSIVRDYEVRKTRSSIQDSHMTERGFVVRVCDKGRYAEYSFNKLPGGSLEAFYAEITERLISGESDARFPCCVYPLPEEEILTSTYAADVEILPGSTGDDTILTRLTSIRDSGLAAESLLVDFAATYTYGHISKCFVSSKKKLRQSYVWSCGYITPTIRKGDVTKWFYQSFSGLKGLELLDEIMGSIPEVISVVRELLDSTPMIPGMYDVVCSPSVAGLIAHEAFGHGVELDMFVKNRAKAADYLGKPVASPLVSMRDGAATAKEVASYFFDDEGTLAGDTLVIDRGLLKSGISDLLSALSMGLKPTGNGRRESFERKTYSRMTNTVFGPGDSNPEDMISSIDHGFLLEHSLGGMEDPKNWGIQCSCIVAREIKAGKLTGKVFSPALITGYVPDMLSSISMVSKDVDLSGSGSGHCGKGYKELAKVSAGGPFIKAKVRLG